MGLSALGCSPSVVRRPFVTQHHDVIGRIVRTVAPTGEPTRDVVAAPRPLGPCAGQVVEPLRRLVGRLLDPLDDLAHYFDEDTHDCEVDDHVPGPVEPSSLTRTPVRKCRYCGVFLILWDEEDADVEVGR